jgi:mannosyltransferase OCH1-like enzyme
MIPKIIHRVIPEQQTDLMIECWDSVKFILPEWEHITHYDKENLPLTGSYLDLCTHGAFRADLIRLESLYIYGGVYLDSDIKLLKSINILLKNNFFLVRENGYTIANSVIGTTKNNPAIFEAINLSIELLKRGALNKKNNNTVDNTGFAFGPYVITKISQKYSNIKILKTKTFFPYSYKEKNLENIDYSLDDDVFGVHKWAGSWIKK